MDKMFNVSLRKRGGLWFLKLGRITVMFCVSRALTTTPALKPEDLNGYLVPKSWDRLKKHWDDEARRLHDNLRG